MPGITRLLTVGLKTEAGRHVGGEIPPSACIQFAAGNIRGGIYVMGSRVVIYSGRKGSKNKGEKNGQGNNHYFKRNCRQP